MTVSLLRRPLAIVALLLTLVSGAVPTYAACPSFPATIPAGNSAALIEAITCANALPTNDVITLTASTYSLSAINAGGAGLPPILTGLTAGTLTVNGNGATIARNSDGGTPDFRLIQVNSGGNLTLNRVILTNGSQPGQNGGAVRNQGVLRLNDSRITSSLANSGGGLHNSGIAALMNTLIDGNTATLTGGGLANDNLLRLHNSTVSGNTVTGADSSSGGAAIESEGLLASAILVNSTITQNTAGQVTHSGLWIRQGSATIQNSIIVSNSGANNCLFVSGTTLNDNGGNLDSGTTCGFGGLTGQNTNPLLGPLADNGGFTPTHAPRFNSAAINAGIIANATDPDGNALTTDQRGAGFARVVGGFVDIGAVEFVCPAFPVTISGGDSAGLIDAIGCANASSSNDTITLEAGTYTFTTVIEDGSALPTIDAVSISGTLTINGAGADTTILQRDPAAPNMRLFNVVGNASLTLTGVQLTGGLNTSNGGAILNAGALTVRDSWLTGNRAGSGGAIHNSGSLTVLRSTLSGNRGNNTGGAITNIGTLWVINSTLSGNNANTASGGGALINAGALSSVVITNSTIASNQTGLGIGYSIISLEGAFQIANTIIADNVLNCAFDHPITDLGGNLDSGTTCGFSGLTGQNTNALLGPLQINNGTTPTHDPAFNSPAINAGINANAVDQSGAALTTDQRGAIAPRVQGVIVDSGAIERPATIFSLRVTSQGRTGVFPHPSHVVTVTVQFRRAGGTEIITRTGTTNTNGELFLSDIPTGAFLVRVKGAHTLARQTAVSINSSPPAYHLITDPLPEGDATDDNVITVADFSILAASFGKATSQPGFDARADFDQDGAVTVADFSLLAANFGQAGAAP